MTRATKLAILLSILAVAARFVWIDQPYIDNWSWRQSDVAAIARNFLKNGFQFARPQIDWAGDQQLYLLKKENSELEQRAILPVRFVPMAGEASKK